MVPRDLFNYTSVIPLVAGQLFVGPNGAVVNSQG